MVSLRISRCKTDTGSLQARCETMDMDNFHPFSEASHCRHRCRMTAIIGLRRPLKAVHRLDKDFVSTPEHFVQTMLITSQLANPWSHPVHQKLSLSITHSPYSQTPHRNRSPRTMKWLKRWAPWISMADPARNGNDARRTRAKQVNSLLIKAIRTNVMILILTIRNSEFAAHPFLRIVVRLGELSRYHKSLHIKRRAKGRNKGRMIGRGMAMMLVQTLWLLIEILFSSAHSQPRARGRLPSELHKCLYDHSHPWASAVHRMVIDTNLLSMTTWPDEVRRECFNSKRHRFSNRLM